MALHSKWVNGNLIFYDGTRELLKIEKGADGGVVANYPDPNTATSTANITLTTDSNRVQFLNVTATGGISLILPTPAAANAGVEFKVFNTSTSDYAITAKSGSTTGSTVVTIQYNEGAVLISDGSNWKGLVGANT